MANEMSASERTKPKAMRVRSRILVFRDSTSPLDKPCLIAARICWRCAATRNGRVTKIRYRWVVPTGSSVRVASSALSAGDGRRYVGPL